MSFTSILTCRLERLIPQKYFSDKRQPGEAFSKRFYEKFKSEIILASYIDDFFGGPKRSQAGVEHDKLRAKVLFKQLIAVGELTGARMNLRKCYPPARVMEILGFIYDSIKKSCRLSEKKKEKYIRRIMKPFAPHT